MASILPLAALLTGTLFTVGIAVLFVVVIAVRKRRCQGGRNLCDDKDKHLGKNLKHKLFQRSKENVWIFSKRSN